MKIKGVCMGGYNGISQDQQDVDPCTQGHLILPHRAQ